MSDSTDSPDSDSFSNYSVFRISPTSQHFYFHFLLAKWSKPTLSSQGARAGIAAQQPLLPQTEKLGGIKPCLEVQAEPLPLRWADQRLGPSLLNYSYGVFPSFTYSCWPEIMRNFWGNWGKCLLQESLPPTSSWELLRCVPWRHQLYLTPRFAKNAVVQAILQAAENDKALQTI